MKKRLCIAALLAATSASVPAADFGLGVTVDSGRAIYFPIRFEDRFVLEPYYEEVTIDTGLEGIDTSNMLSEYGLGLFALTPIRDKVRTYLGLRVGFVSQEFTDDSGPTSQKQDGTRIAPTLGAEFQVTPRLSVAGEADWSVLEIDGELKDSGFTFDIDQDISESRTRIVVRYMF